MRLNEDVIPSIWHHICGVKTDEDGRMGVESKFYILPEESGYRPNSVKICELIRVLRKARYLCDPASEYFDINNHKQGSIAEPSKYEGFKWRVDRTRGQGSLDDFELHLKNKEISDVLLLWPTADLDKSGLTYPLTVLPEGDVIYFDVEIHLSANTIYHISEIIEPFENLCCSCGAPISAFDDQDNSPLFDPRLPNYCPSCYLKTNYSYSPMVIRDGRTGARSQAVGGVTYRFCVVIDCGKMWPKEDVTVHGDLIMLIENCLGCRTRVVQDFY